MASKKSKEQVQEVATSRGFVFVDDVYLGSQVLHHWRCARAQHIFLAKYNAIQQGSGCPECWKKDLTLPRPNVSHKGKGRSYTRDEVDLMIRLFREGKSYRAISEETGFVFSTVVWHVKKALGPESVRRTGRKKKYSGLDKFQVRKHRNLRKSYGISFEQYSEMLRVQNGVCDICHKPPMQQAQQSSVLCVDHDHDTGIVRSLICSNCNKGLGQFKDDPDLLEEAAAYLRRHGKGVKKRAA